MFKLNTSFNSIYNQVVCYEMFGNSQNLYSLSAACTHMHAHLTALVAITFCAYDGVPSQES